MVCKRNKGFSSPSSSFLGERSLAHFDALRRQSEAYEQLVQEGSADASDYRILGCLYHKLGEYFPEFYELAASSLETCLHLDPENAKAHLLLGFTYNALFQPSSARKHFEEAAKLDIGNACFTEHYFPRG